MTAKTSLPDSIQNTILLINRLQELLENEQQALADNNAETIQELLPIKLSLLSQLEQNASERSEILIKEGFEPNEAGVLNYLDSSNDKEALTSNWTKLQSALKLCKESNAANGKIIHRSKQQTSTLLNLMRGQSDNQKIYTDSGSSTSVHQQQPLAKA